MAQKQIYAITPGSSFAHMFAATNLIKLFGQAWKPGLQVGIPHDITMDTIERDPILARDLVRASISGALRDWPFQVQPPLLILNIEPREDWSLEESIHKGFDKYDERAIRWMSDQARDLIPGADVTVYRVPHVLRRQEMTEQRIIKNFMSAKYPLAPLDSVTTNLYPDAREIAEAWSPSRRGMHERRVSHAFDLIDQLAEGRQNRPMIWTGWLNRPALRSHFEVIFEALESRPDITELIIWMDVTGADEIAEVKANVQLARLKELEDLFEHWLGD